MHPAPLNADPDDAVVLLVDDMPDNIAPLHDALDAAGYTVLVALDGQSALARAAQARPDVILLDVMMPGIDGFATCRQLREKYGDHCAPVIFITAKSESDDVVQGFAAGGVDYLPKPFRAKEVVARIRLHLQNRALIGQQRQGDVLRRVALSAHVHQLHQGGGLPAGIHVPAARQPHHP